MRIYKIDGIKPFWQGQCPICRNEMSFLDMQDLASCSWPLCKTWFDVIYEGGIPTLSKSKELNKQRIASFPW